MFASGVCFGVLLGYESFDLLGVVVAAAFERVHFQPSGLDGLHDLQARDAALEGVEQLAAGHEVCWHGGFSSRNKCKRALVAESPECPSILIISHVSVVER